MSHALPSSLTVIQRFCSQHKKLLLGLAALLIVIPLALLGLSYSLITPFDKYILKPGDKTSMTQTNARVGLVLGAGITKEGKPFRELQARLDVAAEALQKGYVDKLLLSGDNRFRRYDEPKAMRDYLVEVQHIAKSRLQVDDAGRSTYESCERAAKVFGLRQVIIFSAGSHLPRAIFLCRSFGIQAYGISSTVEANNAKRREIVARAKAVFNVYIYGEHTTLGPPISVKPGPKGRPGL